MAETQERTEMKRFTVSLPQADYENLRTLVERQQPRLTMNYGVQFAVKMLLEAADERQLPLGFGNPTIQAPR